MKDIRSFLGLCGFYQRFIQKFADLASPLTDLLRKDVVWCWDAIQEKAFVSLKAALVSSAELAYPNLSQPFTVHLDASATAIGATLSQEDSDGHLRLITCTSRKLTPPERNYPTHQRELLALVDCFQRWKHYLLGGKVVAYTDNVSLKYLRTMQDPHPRIVRWLSFLGMYDFDIQHIPGTTNTAADALSRLCPVVAGAPLEPDSWKQFYLSDPTIGPDYYHDGMLIDPTLWHHGRLWVDDRILVPAAKIAETIAAHHSSVLAGHWGAQKTFDILDRKFIIAEMRARVKEFCRTCDACQRVKADRRNQHGLLEPLSLPTRKWHSVSMDWVVGLPLVYRRGQEYDAVLVFTDRATKMVHLVPTSRHETSEDTARLLVEHVVKYHGIPRSLHTDRDTRITSHFWEHVCQVLGIKVRSTTAFHPQGNGQAERSNQTMKQLLRIATVTGLCWFDCLPSAEMAMNSAPIAHTKFSPYFLNYGFNPCTVPDVFDFEAPCHTISEDAKQFCERMRQEWHAAHVLMTKLKSAQEQQANRHRQPHMFAVGDEVLVNVRTAPRDQLAVAGVLGPRFAGPYRILAKSHGKFFSLATPAPSIPYA